MLAVLILSKYPLNRSLMLFTPQSISCFSNDSRQIKFTSKSVFRPTKRVYFFATPDAHPYRRNGSVLASMVHINDSTLTRNKGLHAGSFLERFLDRSDTFSVFFLSPGTIWKSASPA